MAGSGMLPRPCRRLGSGRSGCGGRVEEGSCRERASRADSRTGRRRAAAASGAAPRALGDWLAACRSALTASRGNPAPHRACKAVWSTCNGWAGSHRVGCSPGGAQGCPAACRGRWAGGHAARPAPEASALRSRRPYGSTTLPVAAHALYARLPLQEQRKDGALGRLPSLTPVHAVQLGLEAIPPASSVLKTCTHARGHCKRFEGRRITTRGRCCRRHHRRCRHCSHPLSTKASTPGGLPTSEFILTVHGSACWTTRRVARLLLRCRLHWPMVPAGGGPCQPTMHAS